eukprot:CAMPEP_0168623574 /NCGR_PEP_ID=MMETSP0449_2-20121227/8904_1 /TAXON_ID=1082188 /ORGANISM="Strombidium rassoulzadegani, Strain ras09" /LENGTH=50 /DNA_ID=CAMNT_0008664977 /DNA_START=4 /DNA_END=156 /DNA_ORIENTATION=-
MAVTGVESIILVTEDRATREGEESLEATVEVAGAGEEEEETAADSEGTTI